MKEILKNGCEKLNIKLTAKMAEQFEKYYSFLIEYNKNVNLTAITQKQDVAVKHFIDSGSLLSVLDIKEGAKLIDVGSGAGFPGLVIKILRPDIDITLVDSLNKRIVFLQKCCEVLGIEANCIHARAEELAKKSGFRESYDVATSRAVANLTTLCEYCLAFVKVGGVFAPLKGPCADEEIKNAQPAIKLLGGKLLKISDVCIESLGHKIVLIDKIQKTPAKYPRNGAKPINNPLK